MDVLDDMCLARAILTQYQHAHLGRRNQMYPFLDIPACFPVPYEYQDLTVSFLLTLPDNGMEKRDKPVLEQPLIGFQ